MKRGDCFIIDIKCRPGIYTAARLSKVKVIVRKIDGNKVRVWRAS